MHEENLVVKVKRTAKYNSYAGEVTPAVPNGIERNFYAEKPNFKWLTDITEFLVSLNKKYDPIPIKPETNFKVFGKVVG